MGEGWQGKISTVYEVGEGMERSFVKKRIHRMGSKKGRGRKRSMNRGI